MSSAGVRRCSSRRSRAPDPLPSQPCEDVRMETSDGETSTWPEVKKEETLELNISNHGDDLHTKPEDIPIKEEGPDHKDQLYCEICKSFFFNKCKVHGSPLFIPDTPVPMGVSDRAKQTLPPGLEIQESSIPDAGLGVFNKGETVPVGAHFGPYQGELVDREETMDSGYSWAGNAEKKLNNMSEEVDPAQLVQEVEKRALIWDVSLPNYSDCYKKAKAWESIAKQLVKEWENKSVREKKEEVKRLKKRWKSLRDRFTRDMKNMNEKRSGMGSTKRKKSHPLFEEMLFLKSSTEKRQTSGNVYDSTSTTGSEVTYVDDGETSNPEEVQRHSTPLLRTPRKTKVKPRRAEKKRPDLDIMMIHRSKTCEEYVDAKREILANWMRYVNCARNDDEQNLVAFQYRGEILYRCCRPISPGQELLVWYEEDAKDLSPGFDHFWNKKCFMNEIHNILLHVFSYSFPLHLKFT
ncbi:uncharacterized protein Hap1MRO34_011847 isoform 2-T2 [Clarias gariepinus]|uniref:uncharacterized protein LOC128523662 isoform X2 n=1 Tax=Clarias gariepinus TaxID=13013 RepID=UPI00234DFA0F|nr:uncharacterized protein LOC128523662 isoform X2 [Clarias gariepinus]